MKTFLPRCFLLLLFSGLFFNAFSQRSFVALGTPLQVAASWPTLGKFSDGDMLMEMGLQFAKVDTNGVVKWAKLFTVNQPKKFYPNANCQMLTTRDNHFIMAVTGTRPDTAKNFLLICRMDENLAVENYKIAYFDNVITNNSFIRTPDNTIMQATDGGIVVENASGTVLKFDSALNFLWGKILTPVSSDVTLHYASVYEGSTGDLFLPAVTNTRVVYSDYASAVISKLDKDGNYIISKNFTTNDTGHNFLLINSLTSAGGSNFMAPGLWGVGTGYYNGQAWTEHVIKMDENFNVKWSNRYPIAQTSYLNSMVSSGDDFIAMGIIAADLKDFVTSVLLKIDSSGKFLWHSEIKHTWSNPLHILYAQSLQLLSPLLHFNNNSYYYQGFVYLPLERLVPSQQTLAKFSTYRDVCFGKNYKIDVIKDTPVVSDLSFNISDFANVLDDSDMFTLTDVPLGPTTFLCKDDVLPLQLLSFTATNGGKVNNLAWATAQEINTSYFDVERSSDATSFTPIGRVNAQSKSSSNTYAFTDALPMQAINFYRLKMVDKDGQYTYSSIKSVNNSAGAFAAILYPNPVRNTASLQCSANKTQKVTIQLADISGKVLLTEQFTAAPGITTKSINVKALAQGMYMVIIKTGDAAQLSLKLIKE